MINYIEKGGNLHGAIADAGFHLKANTNNEAYDINGKQSPAIDAAVQAIIDNFDPLPEAKNESIEKVNVAAGEARAKYATDIPFQTEAYNAKLTDAKAFRDGGYDELTLTNYPYTSSRATRQSITGKAAADYIIAVAAQWDMLMFGIEDTRDATIEAINAEKDWLQCNVIADAVVVELGKI